MVDAILGFHKTYCVLGHIEADHGIRRLEGHKGNNREPVSQISFQQEIWNVDKNWFPPKTQVFFGHSQSQKSPFAVFPIIDLEFGTGMTSRNRGEIWDLYEKFGTLIISVLICFQNSYGLRP